MTIRSLWPEDIGKLPDNAWEEHETYNTGDEVWCDGMTYCCDAMHTANIVNRPATGHGWFNFWTIVAEKKGRVSDWRQAGVYEPGDRVENEPGDRFTCTTRHESSVHNEPGAGMEWLTYWDIYYRSGNGNGEEESD